MKKIKLEMFTAQWCGPCKAVKSWLPDFCEKNDIELNILDIEANESICVDKGIRSVPTILFYIDGEKVDDHVGSFAEAYLIQRLKQHEPEFDIA